MNYLANIYDKRELKIILLADLRLTESPLQNNVIDIFTVYLTGCRYVYLTGYRMTWSLSNIESLNQHINTPLVIIYYSAVH